MWCKRSKNTLYNKYYSNYTPFNFLKDSTWQQDINNAGKSYFSIPIYIAFKSSTLQKLLRCIKDKIACINIVLAFRQGYKLDIQYWLADTIVRYHTTGKDFQINNCTMLIMLSVFCFPLSYDFFSWWNSKDIAKTRIDTRQLLLKFLSLTW